MNRWLFDLLRWVGLTMCRLDYVVGQQQTGTTYHWVSSELVVRSRVVVQHSFWTTGADGKCPVAIRPVLYVSRRAIPMPVAENKWLRSVFLTVGDRIDFEYHINFKNGSEQ